MNDLKQSLEIFLAEMPLDDIAADASHRSERMDVAAMRALLTTFANEARATLEVAMPLLHPRRRLLEVGAGLCLFSAFLRREGFDVTALEPVMGGFDAFAALRASVLKWYEDVRLPLLTIPAEGLDAGKHGRFDVIFSNNVIEHIPDWEAALDAMLGVLAEDGRMAHACPNYSVPYEPHYGVPVWRLRPMWTRRWLLSVNADMSIWDSLNFITCRQVQRFGRRRGVRVIFRKGLLYRAVRRLREDETFRRRHAGLGRVADVLSTLGLLRVLRFLPPCASTPMVFEILHDGCGRG